MLPTRLQTSRSSFTKLTGIIMESLDPSMLVSESDQSMLLQMRQLLIANLLDMDTARVPWRVARALAIIPLESIECDC